MNYQQEMIFIFLSLIGIKIPISGKSLKIQLEEITSIFTPNMSAPRVIKAFFIAQYLVQRCNILRNLRDFLSHYGTKK